MLGSVKMGPEVERRVLEIPVQRFGEDIEINAPGRAERFKVIRDRERKSMMLEASAAEGPR